MTHGLLLRNDFFLDYYNNLPIAQEGVIICLFDPFKRPLVVHIIWMSSSLFMGFLSLYSRSVGLNLNKFTTV